MLLILLLIIHFSFFLAVPRKGTLSDGNGGEVHQVHGITTAASVWLAAAVGVGAGGALYAVTAYSVSSFGNINHHSSLSTFSYFASHLLSLSIS